MRQLTRFAASAAATVMAAASIAAVLGGSGTATADGTDTAAGSFVPLSPVLRRCDWSPAPYVPSDTRGSGNTTITSSGNTVTAEVHVITMIPDIFYGVRLVQVPRPGIGCAAGDPGVGFAQLFTDSVGTGTVTVQAPVMSGANGAWVSVEGPLGNSKNLSGDFWTSDYVVHI